MIPLRQLGPYQVELKMIPLKPEVHGPPGRRTTPRFFVVLVRKVENSVLGPIGAGPWIPA